jgi:hypothetical protein
MDCVVSIPLGLVIGGSQIALRGCAPALQLIMDEIGKTIESTVVQRAAAPLVQPQAAAKAQVRFKSPLELAGNARIENSDTDFLVEGE